MKGNIKKGLCSLLLCCILLTTMPGFSAHATEDFISPSAYRPLDVPQHHSDFSAFLPQPIQDASGQTVVPPLQDQRVLVILIDFDNIPFLDREDDLFFYNKMFDTRPNAFSAANYFRDMSGGLDVISPAQTVGLITGGTFFVSLESYVGFGPYRHPWWDGGVYVTIAPSEQEGIVRVRMEKPHSDSNTISIAVMTDFYSMALKAIEQNQRDFSFENYGDSLIVSGFNVAHPYVVIGGFALPHSAVFNSTVHAPRVRLAITYAGRPKDGIPMPSFGFGIQIPIHELLHTFGIPDMDRDSTLLCLMLSGWSVSYYVPPILNPLSRYRLGWITPITIDATEDWFGYLHTFEVSPPEQWNLLKIRSSTSNTEFLLVENRQLSNRWDAGLAHCGWRQWGATMPTNPGGIVVYRVDSTYFPGVLGQLDVHGSVVAADANGRNWRGFINPFFRRDKATLFHEDGITIRVLSDSDSSMKIAVAPIDRAALQSFVCKALTRDGRAYTNATWRMVLAALQTADAILANNYAPQSEIEEAYIALHEALNSLITIASFGSPFHDVAENDWFYPFVLYANANGLMQGAAWMIFAPNETMTRAQMVQVLYNMEGQPAIDFEPIFDDIAEGAWYANAVIWAEQNGIVAGMGDGIFAPGANITREQMATILHQYAAWKGYNTTVPAASDAWERFPDRHQSSDWAVNALQWAVYNGLISGTNGNLLPQGTATRAQCAAILQNFIERFEFER